MLAGRELEEADNPKIIDPRSWKAFCLRQPADLPNYLLLRLTLQLALPSKPKLPCVLGTVLQGRGSGSLSLRGKLRPRG